MDRTSVPGYCPLCRSRCGCISILEEGRLVRVEPDRSHPTGKALCSKGRAAPDLVQSSQRLLHPLLRTRPKECSDPGWKRIGWAEALERAGAELKRLKQSHGAESVAFSLSSPSASAMSDSLVWALRLINLYGSPNICTASEYCNWQKDFTTREIFGSHLPVPDYERTGCMVLWGFNPVTSWLSQAVAVKQAQRRGARLVVVDPRRSGLATRADQWLQVRPGRDGVLALGLSHLLIEEGLFDAGFVRKWTTGGCLVREDTGHSLRAGDLGSARHPDSLTFWDPELPGPCSRQADPGKAERAALRGRFTLQTRNGVVSCRPGFDYFARSCAQFPPQRVEEETGISPGQLQETAQLLASARPTSYYTWSGIEQHATGTQTSRAIARLFALLGDFDAPGGNVIFEKIPLSDLSASEFLPPEKRSRTLGLEERPGGPAQKGWITAHDLYRAIREQEPYTVRGLVALGSNLLASRPDPEGGRKALQQLEFYLHADLFMNPTAELADIVLPVSSAWEREGLRAGFEVGQPAENRIQLRPAVVEPPGEARSDTRVIFDLALELGLAEHFWQGDVERALAELLEPSGVRPAELRRNPQGVEVLLETRFRKYEEQGFDTPTRLVELYDSKCEGAEVQAIGSPENMQFPLILTCAKLPQFCNTQHRSLPLLRRHRPEPAIEIHPRTAELRGIEEGDWVLVSSPAGQMRARAFLSDRLAEDVLSSDFGWWQECPSLKIEATPLTGPANSNFNGLIGADLQDPVSGALSLRSYCCEVEKAGGEGRGVRGEE